MEKNLPQNTNTEPKENQGDIYDDDVKNLVVARLKALPSDLILSMGLDGSFSKKELIEHVENEDDIGTKIVEIQMDYLRTLKDGFDSLPYSNEPEHSNNKAQF